MTKNKATLYLMLGYPGAGKTTAAEEINKLTGAIHLSSDAFHIAAFKKQTFGQEEHNIRYRSLDYFCELLIKNGVSVIYDANLNRRKHRNEKYEIAKKYDVEVKLIWVNAPLKLAQKRATVIGDSDPKRPYGNLKDDVFDRISKQIQLPQKEEPTIELDGTKITNSYVRDRLGL